MQHKRKQPSFTPEIQILNLRMAAHLRGALAISPYWLPDGVGTNGVFTEGPQIPTFCHCLFWVRTCCHICHMLSYVVICCYILSTFSRESSLGGIAALLRQPRLSRPRLEAGDHRVSPLWLPSLAPVFLAARPAVQQQPRGSGEAGRAGGNGVLRGDIGRVSLELTCCYYLTCHTLSYYHLTSHTHTHTLSSYLFVHTLSYLCKPLQ